jgi:RNA polymerase sigma-70 factor (ECF subfamily)
MALTSPAGTLGEQPSAALREFVAEHYGACGAAEVGLDRMALAAMLAQIAAQAGPFDDAASELSFLQSLRLEELVLARACALGSEHAWEVFLNRYRNILYESAYKIAPVESEARILADSLYAELYGVDAKGQQRTSKLLYYQGRGSLQGWLRVVVAQEYINRYRGTRRETSLDAAVEGGAQFAIAQAECVAIDPRVEAAVSAELAALDGNERLLLAAYYLDHRTLAEIAKLLGVHESTISRKLVRITSAARKRIRKRLMQSGMTGRQADEVMEDVEVRDLRVKVRETLEQGPPDSTFYQKKGESQG